MKRSKFLVSILAVFAAPALTLARSKAILKRKEKGFKIAAGEGRIHGHIQLKGVNANILDVKISGSDTDGAFAMFEQTSLSQGRGTPLHIHDEQDEIFYVLEGSYYFRVGEDTYQLSQGESIFLPRKLPHAWTQVSEKGKMNVLLQPAGKLEDFFVTMSSLDHEPGPAEIAQIFSDNQMRVVGPPLKPQPLPDEAVPCVLRIHEHAVFPVRNSTCIAGPNGRITLNFFFKKREDLLNFFFAIPG